MPDRRNSAGWLTGWLCLALVLTGCAKSEKSTSGTSATTEPMPAEIVTPPAGNAPTTPIPAADAVTPPPTPAGEEGATKDGAPAEQEIAISVGGVVDSSNSTSSASAWPLFRGDSRSTGVSADDLSGDLELLWKREIPEASFEATATIVDGVVYVGSLDGNLYALDLASGEEKWRFPTELGFYAGASYRDGRLYVGDADGAFYCVNAADGSKLWSVQARAEIDGAANFHGDHVLFGSQDATLYCLDAATGAEVWKHTIDDQIRCSPTIIDDRAFVAGCDGNLHVIDLNSGQSVAKVPIEAQTGCTPAASGDRVYFGTEGGVFFCIDWRKGEVVWKYHDPGHNLPIRSSAALTDEIVVVGARDKRLHAFDPARGEEKWKFATKGRIDGSPVIAAGRAYVGSADGRVYGIDLKSGEVAWEYEAGGGFIASPAVAEGKLVIGNDDGVLFCFGEGTAKEKTP